MSPKRKAPNSPHSESKRSSTKPSIFAGRDVLGAYILSPKKYPASVVIYHNDSFVAINDLYPKSSVHCLLLSRSSKNTLHPFDAFEDLELLAKVQEEAKKLRALVAKELRRKYGRFSAKE